MATDFDFAPAVNRTFYFIGVTTKQSSIMRVFPEWAAHLDLGDCTIRGVDCDRHDDPQVYYRLVQFFKNDACSLGALVTTHKIDLLAAARELFDDLDPNAVLLNEVSCISKRNNRLIGHAKDPVTAGLSYQAIVPDDYWRNIDGEICILGAGGSSLALTIHLMQLPEEQRPSKIQITNRSEKRLLEMKKIHDNIDCPIPVQYHLCPIPQMNDVIVDRLKPGSMVINASGLGKDAPGSPLTGQVNFPENGIIWDFNYRGDLVFLDQARSQKQSKSLTIEDGWVYFIYGWTSVIAEVFSIKIPVSGPEFNKYVEIAASVR
jgi:shikimate 5-dehydrogenase